MSRYTYAEPYRNPTEGMYVKEFVNDAQDEWQYEIWVRQERAEDGSAPPDHKHTSAPTFDTMEDANEWLDGLSEFYEQDYEQYLEENHTELVRMELYELWRNEY